MKTAIAMLAFLVLIGCGPNEDDISRTHGHVSQLKQEFHEFTITCPNEEKDSIWRTSEEQNPPVAVAEAIRLATQIAPEFFEEGTEIQIDEVSLLPCMAPDSWYYVVQFSEKDWDLKLALTQTNLATHDYLQIGVLMDGTVIRPGPRR